MRWWSRAWSTAFPMILPVQALFRSFDAFPLRSQSAALINHVNHLTPYTVFLSAVSHVSSHFFNKSITSRVSLHFTYQFTNIEVVLSCLVVAYSTGKLSSTLILWNPSINSIKDVVCINYGFWDSSWMLTYPSRTPSKWHQRSIERLSKIRKKMKSFRLCNFPP